MTTSQRSSTAHVPLSDRIRPYVPKAVRRTTRGFMLVLVLLIAIYYISEVTDQAGAELAATWTLAYLAFTVTLRAISAQPRTVYINLAVMLALSALALVGVATDQEPMIVPAGAAVSVYAFTAPVLIMYHVLRQDRITTDLIFGALSVYVFIGIDFAIIYDLIHQLEPASFAFAHEGIGSLFYFSFMTLTTVGYGDITPISDGARALTVVQAITGQILLIVIVARLIGIQIAQQHGPSQDAKA